MSGAMTKEEVQRIVELATQVHEIGQALLDEVSHRSDAPYPAGVESAIKAEVLRTNLAIAKARLESAREEIVKAVLARGAA